MRGLIAGVAVALALAVLPASASAATPQSFPYLLDWPALLPALPAKYQPSIEPDCITGEPTCIDHTIDEMYRRFNDVIPPCGHNAVFSLAYTRVTEDIREALHTGFFDDPAWLQNEDAVFARMYFVAYDDWAAGRRDRVPEAWRIAFDSARDRRVTGLGNFLLSMNAHIQRDMPYLLAGVGIRRPDGLTRKPDHDRYNRRLSALYEPVITETADRFDPTADDGELGPVDDVVATLVLQGWREIVWRNAERLVLARTAPERLAAAQSVELYATIVARMVRELLAYRRDLEPQRREAWCASHGGQQPGAGSAPLPPLEVNRPGR